MEPGMIFATSANTAYCPMFRQSGSLPQGIYVTNDGGTTWTQQTTALFNNASSFPNCIHFFDANTGWCMGDPINGDFEIYTTTDAGTTWTLVPGAQIPKPVSGEFGVVGYYSAVNDTIWFGTNKGRIYKSVDKGHNWTVAQCPGWTTKYVKPVFKSGSYGLAQDLSSGTTGALQVTTDGGATWAPLTTTGNVWYNDIAYVPGSPGTFVTTGANPGPPDATGFTYSFDNGVDWNDMTETLGTQFLATDWLNDSVAWAGSFNTDATTGGMFKFVSVLAQPVANFSASDTAIVLGGQIQYSNLSTGKPTSYTWTFEGGAPGSSTLKVPPPITYNTPGDFNVTLKVVNSFGDNTLLKTNYIHVGGVGINDISNVSITMYPNPARDVLNLSCSQTIQTIQIYNLVGQSVVDLKADSKEYTVNVSNLNNGVYTLKLTINDKPYIKKIVIN
jgi:photosystem II stability/assembly factor-like uncharacterized protein